ncbi:MAG: DNA cytosine methyltransferase, partial [Collinsella sp.]
SNTQAYKQFGNSVAVPVIRAIAEQIVPIITKAGA